MNPVDEVAKILAEEQYENDRLGYLGVTPFRFLPDKTQENLIARKRPVAEKIVKGVAPTILWDAAKYVCNYDPHTTLDEEQSVLEECQSRIQDLIDDYKEGPIG